jgi:hypothetical protein
MGIQGEIIEVTGIALRVDSGLVYNVTGIAITQLGKVGPRVVGWAHRPSTRSERHADKEH